MTQDACRIPIIDKVKYSLLKSNISNISPLTSASACLLSRHSRNTKNVSLVSKNKVKVKTARATASTLG